MTKQVKLTGSQIKLLESLPEQGMGYQLVDIKLISGKLLSKRIVLNSVYLKLEEGENIDPAQIEWIRLHT